MTEICLSMIVKNEAHVLARCLRSVLPIITSYKIVDTGSTDSTDQVLKAWLAHLPGEIQHHPWKDDFAFHRNQALPAPGFDGYVLIMDADDELLIGPNFNPANLKEDCYSVVDIQGGMMNFRPHLFRVKEGIKWMGVRHEDVWGFPEAHALDPGELRIAVRHEGDRSKNPNRFLHDAEVLLKARKKLKKGDPYNLYSIYTSHIGQSFCDAKDYLNAIKYFREYVTLTGKTHHDFTYGAYLKIAASQEELHAAPDEVVKAYLDAQAADPSRIESYVLLTFFLCRQGRFLDAKKIMDQAMALEFKFQAINQMTKWWKERDAIYEQVVQAALLQQEKGVKE